jgi:hypothetical protein
VNPGGTTRSSGFRSWIESRPSPEQGLVDAAAQDGQHVRDPGLAAGGHAPQAGPPDQDRLRAQSDCLDHVAATADAAVEEHLDLVSDGDDDAGQGADRGRVPSRLLPPWLDTEMAMAPMSTARRESSGCMIPCP